MLGQAHHINTEDETINIYECNKEPFVGQYILELIDDGPNPVHARMLLDEETIVWLLEKLTLIKNQKVLE